MGKERGDEGVQMHAVEILQICEEVGVKVEYMNWVSSLPLSFFSLSQLNLSLAAPHIMLCPSFPNTPPARA